jgi:hypothetical protein
MDNTEVKVKIGQIPGVPLTAYRSAIGDYIITRTFMDGRKKIYIFEYAKDVEIFKNRVKQELINGKEYE